MLEKGELVVAFFYGLLHMDTPILAEQQVLTFIRSVWTQETI